VRRISCRGLLLLLGCAIFPSAGCGKAPAPAPPPPLPPAAVVPPARPVPAPIPVFPEDPVARGLYEEITAACAAVESYTCDWQGRETGQISGGPNAGQAYEMIHSEQRVFQKPGKLYVKHRQVAHPHDQLVGELRERFVDGAHVWEYVQPATRSGDEGAAKAKRASEHPHVFHKDIAKLRAAGFWEQKVWPGLEPFLFPFFVCDVASLRLESETDAAWTFIARPKAEAAQTLSEVWVRIGKADYMLQEQRATLRSGRGENVQTVSNLVLNPALPDAQFTYTPPAGLEVLDRTEDDLPPPQ